MFDTVIYLVENYWIFLSLALLVGIATGWLSANAD